MKILYVVFLCIGNFVRSHDCPGGWLHYGDRCFKINVNDNQDFTSWIDADQLCKMLGPKATLVSIHSPEENEYLYQEAKKQMGGKVHIWIGMHKSVYAKGFPYIWKDQSQVNYVNWDEGEPNDIDGTQNCCRMYEFNGKWDDYDCSGQDTEQYHGYICEYEPVSKEDSSVILPPLPSQGCCHAGDVFAIIFGIIIAVEIVLGVLGYMYFFQWDKQFPWQQKGTTSGGSSAPSGTPTSMDNPDYVSKQTA